MAELHTLPPTSPDPVERVFEQSVRAGRLALHRELDLLQLRSENMAQSAIRTGLRWFLISILLVTGLFIFLSGAAVWLTERFRLSETLTPVILGALFLLAALGLRWRALTRFTRASKDT